MCPGWVYIGWFICVPRLGALVVPGLSKMNQEFLLYSIFHQMAITTEYCSFQSELATGTVTRRTISQRTSEKCINPL